MFLINGSSAEQINISNRGLQYGDGLFETIAVYKEQPLAIDAHLTRLLSGCEKLGISSTDKETLLAETNSLCQQQQRAIIKIIITGNEGGRGYQRTTEGECTRIVGRYEWPNHDQSIYSDGINVHLCANQMGHNPTLAGIKHLNRLEQVLARNEWNTDEYFEGIVFDIDGRVIEGTMSNLFAVYDDGLLCTPGLSHCGVKGIVRQNILDNSNADGYQTEVTRLSLDKLLSANEIFFCNSVIGIVPVRQIGEKIFEQFKVANDLRQKLEARGVIAPL